jgi:hypothetical protein
MKTLREVIATLEPAGDDRAARIEPALTADQGKHTPWYIHALIGVGAWLASLFFFAFAGALFGWRLESDRAALGIIGLVVLVGVSLIQRKADGLFIGQCLLAWSLAAQALVVTGFAPENGDILGEIMLLYAALTLVLYFAYPDFLHRTLTCLASAQLIYWWMYYGKSFQGSEPAVVHGESFILQLNLYLLVQLAAICWSFLSPRSYPSRTPIGYALIASMSLTYFIQTLTSWEQIFGRRGDMIGIGHVHWLSFAGPTIIGVFTTGLIVWAAGGIEAAQKRPAPFLFVALTAVTLIALGMNTVLLSLFIFILGFLLQNRLIMGVGLTLLPFFLTHYYYSLYLDLLAKAGVLIGSGAILLLLRAILIRRLIPAMKEAA